jgi:uncharacterized BrkB/YihY/UPF0761 family membrane protein
MGHGQHSSKLVICVVLLLFSLFCILFVCKCVLYYCNRAITQLQLTNISYHIISYIISYHVSLLMFIVVFWILRPCSLVDGCEGFVGADRLHIQFGGCRFHRTVVKHVLCCTV